MKAVNITYWVTTTIIFLFEGLMPALTSQTELAVEGIRHLGYPDYFGTALTVLKVLGTLALIIPMVPHRFKEWAYGCFTIEFLFAAYSHFSVDGADGQSFFPLIILAILLTSYAMYNKRLVHKNA